MAAKYPPFVNAYGNIHNLFAAIKAASVPPKFTNNFMTTSLGLTSSSYRAMIPLLKRLGFIDQANIPTQAYKDFRDESQSGLVMGQQLQKSYADLFTSNEYAYKLNKDEIQTKLRTITGAAADDRNIPSIASTFIELSKLADFEGKQKRTKKKGSDSPVDEASVGTPPSQGVTSDYHRQTRLGISYTINLNLPATTEIEVFNSIFKSLKEHILDEK